MESKANNTNSSTFQITPPIQSSTILAIGAIAYAIGSTWPLLLLVFSYILSQYIPYAYLSNDDAVNRRQRWKEFEALQMEETKEWRDVGNNVVLKEEYWVNARGMCLMTSTMTPKDGDVKAVVCFCHGYSDNASFIKRQEYQRYVQKGIAVVMIEYEGHGRSDGTLGLISNWDHLIDDTSAYFQEITQTRFPELKHFLIGESMGGAVAYYTYNRDPKRWSGVIFISPMCKVSDEMLPPQWVVKAFQAVCGEPGSESILGTLPVAPSANVADLAFKLPHRQQLVYMVPTYYTRKPRLATARELLHVTSVISKTCKQFDAPFLIQHGTDDKVTCPKLSQLFYDNASSQDKELKLYEGMWHTITSGEPKENIDIVINDAINWVLARI